MEYVLLFFGYGYQLNAALAMFNLLPIPPLDGSKVILAFLPERWYITELWSAPVFCWYAAVSCGPTPCPKKGGK